MPSSTSDARELIRAKARSEGFDIVRFANAESSAEAARHLREFLAEGWHGDMTWLAANEDRRATPANLWPDAKSVVMLGANYTPGSDPLRTLAERDRATISVYARGDDYHDVLKARLKRLATFVTETFGADVK